MNRKEQGIIWSEIEPLCMLRLLKKKLWMLIMAFLIGFMGTTVILGSLSSSSYSCSTTFAVTARSGSNYYSHTAAATEVVAIYSELLQGRFMKEMVRQELGSAGGSISASQIGDTNLISVTVSSASPKDALLVMRSVLNNYGSLSDYVSSTAVLSPLSTPNIAIVASKSYNIPRLRLLAGLLCAAAMAAGICTLAALRCTVQTIDGARNRLDGKIIVSIPHEGAGRSRKGGKKRGRMDLRISSPAISFAFAESIHSVASKLEHEHSKGRSVFLFSSVTEGEGKSTIAANTALSLAESHGRVLFIDLDLRRPVQTEILDVKLSRHSGFGDLLLSGASAGEILSSTSIDPATGMEMLLSNRSYTEMIDLLASPLLAQVIELARGRFEYIIIDSPPLGYFSDSEVLGDLSDGTLLVVRQDVAPSAEINDAIDSLRACRAEFLGCILNDMQHLSRAVSRYGYGYGRYGYGKYGYGKYGKYGKYGQSSGK